MKQIIAVLFMLILGTSVGVFYGQQITLRNTRNTLSAIEQDKKELTKEIPEFSAREVDQKIPYHGWVEDCIKRFAAIYGNSEENSMKSTFSAYTAFKKKELLDWLNYLDKNTDCTSIRICYGVYPFAGEDVPADLLRQVDAKRGRLTVFLWPYTNDVKTKKSINMLVQNSLSLQPGADEDPYDLGEIHP